MNIVYIEDHVLMAEGLKAALEQQACIESVSLFNDKQIQEAEKHIEMQHPDIILLDINIGQIDGLDLGEQYIKQFPTIPLVFVTGHNKPEFRRRATEMGASGFISKSTPASKMVTQLNKVVKGEPLDVMESLDKSLLTEKEKEVLNELKTGQPHKAIAYDLGISKRTVDHRVASICQKLDVQNAKEAIVRAIELGFIRVFD